MRRAIGSAILTAVLATLACNFPAANPSPPTVVLTAVMPPTAPPATAVSPPDTPPPALTPIGATALPITPPTVAPATPDPNFSVSDELYRDNFDGLSGWYWTFADAAAQFGANDGALRAQMLGGQNTWRYVVRTDVTASDMQVRVTARTETCGDDDQYGLMFRGRLDVADQIDTYILIANCGGALRIERLRNSETLIVSDWALTPAMKTGAPAENTLTLWAAGDQFHVFANDQHVFSVSDPNLVDGFFGFFLRGRTGSEFAVTFHNFVVRAVVP